MARARSRFGIGILVLLLVVGGLAWRRCGGASGANDRAGGGDASDDDAAARGVAARARGAAGDPRGLARGSIAGIVRDEHGAVLAGASVCTRWWSDVLSTEETREPLCTTTDALGAYRLGDLVGATYAVSASDGPHGAAVWEDADHHQDLRLAPGEARTGVDLALPGGAIEVRGIVEDINGGPIAGALVTLTTGEWWDRGGASGFVRSRPDGTFVLWSKPGQVSVAAAADGYTGGAKEVTEPGTKVELLLTPEGVLAGVVVEAGTKKPVAGALVEVEPDWQSSGGDGDNDGTQRARTDADGKFKLTRLAPGRYKPTAKGDTFYGEPAESVRLALGQTVDGVVIEVHPAATVRGRVVIEGGGKRTGCPRAGVWLQDAKQNLRRNAEAASDGTVAIKAVLPGHYVVQAYCEKNLPKDHYPSIDVAARDVNGLEWTVSAGATIHGRVHTPTGAPVAGARIQAQSTGGDPRGQRSWGWEKTDADGSFTVAGLVAGSYAVNAMADDHPQQKQPTQVTVPADGVATMDITLDTGGTIHGVVVDTGGAGVGGVTVRAMGDHWGWWNGRTLTADDGSFTLAGVDAGQVRVTAAHGWSDQLRNPGNHDDDTQGQRVTVASGQVTEVRLVVEDQQGAIDGVVVDGKGAPVADAYLSATRESDAAGAAEGDALRQSRWDGWEKRPVVTATDGSFRVTSLASGNYTLRAFRKGGGEAVAEHVAVGGRARLEMKAAGSIAGQVAITGGGAPDVFFASASDRKTGFSRSEGFYMTQGAWALNDLPAGTYTVTVTAAEGRASVDLPLADGEDKRDVQLALQRLVTVRGRFIELAGGAPVAGLWSSVVPATDDSMFTMNDDDNGARAFISDAQGRFEVERAPIGRDVVVAFSQDWQTSPYGYVRKLVIVRDSSDAVDVGDIEVPRRRIPARARGGDVGFSLAEEPPDVDPAAFQLQVSHLEPNGPAVKSGLAVGDVIVSVDGVDVRGDRSYLSWTLLNVAQGTVVHVGVARGATIAITAAAPE